MNKILFANLMLLVFVLGCSNPKDAPQAIFNGKSLKGWDGNPDIWKVEDGALTAEIPAGEKLAKNEFIYWENEVNDFELTLDFKITQGTNSGIQIRSQKTDYNTVTGYQCDLDAGDEWLGVLYDEHDRGKIAERGGLTKIMANGDRETIPFQENMALLNRNLKPNDWNQYHIKAIGNRIEIRINGSLYNIIEDYEKDKHDLSGALALQLHSGNGPAKVQFKNMYLKTVEPKAKIATDTTKNVAYRIKNNPLFSNLAHNPEHDGATEYAYVPPGFEMTTVLQEPDVRQPIAFTFDGKGRLWVAEAFAYPQKQPEGEGKDRLVIWEDTDNDGTFETGKVFADDLNLISGFEVGYGGVYASTAPDFIFIPDADGDDVPDGEPQVLLDGWSIRDTHETQNSFMWGHDGWLYGVHGVFNPSKVGKPGTPDEERIDVASAIWRYHPLTDDFEIYAYGGSNQWGLDYNAYGEMFMTHCRSAYGGGPVTQVFRDANYWTQNNRHTNDFIYSYGTGAFFYQTNNDQNNTDEPNYMKSIAAYGHGVGGVGKGGMHSTPNMWGGHSHVGTMVYLGDNWPDEYRNQLYTNNLHGAQINREILEEFDSGYRSSSQGNEPLYMDDENYVAVDLKYGPDGAVYINDWYDTQHCHNRDTEIWNRSNGRIYRLSYQPNYKPRKADMGAATEAELFDYLSDSNEWFSRHSQHEIRQRLAKNEFKNKEAFADKLEPKVLDKKLELAQRFRYLVALYAVDGISVGSYKKLLRDEQAVIRRQAIQFITEQAIGFSKQFNGEFLDMAANDPAADVRLMIASLTQNRLDKALSEEIISTMIQDPRNTQDRFIPKMLWYGYAQFVAQKSSKELKEIMESAQPQIFNSSIVHTLSKESPEKLYDIVNNSNHGQLKSLIIKQLWNDLSEGQDREFVNADWWQKLKQTDVTLLDENAQSKLQDLIILSDNNGLTNVGDIRQMRINKGKQAFAMCATCHQPNSAGAGPSLKEISLLYSHPDPKHKNNLKLKTDLIQWIKKPGKKRDQYPSMPPFASLDAEVYEQLVAYMQNFGQKTHEEQKKKK
ncbi:PVC-type heme-binding CxxCH protein [Sediminicola luteus]|nr:PVC-type heme-binding CxxCH protein [Sediminicola luteus]